MKVKLVIVAMLIAACVSGQTKHVLPSLANQENVLSWRTKINANFKELNDSLWNVGRRTLTFPGAGIVYSNGSTGYGSSLSIQDLGTSSGFLKGNGSSIVFDNTSYTPTSRNISINGVSHNLASDASWTISASIVYPSSGIVVSTGSNFGTSLTTQDLGTSLGYMKGGGTGVVFDNTSYTPTNRTIGINGTTYDLSTNRTFTLTTANIVSASATSATTGTIAVTPGAYELYTITPTGACTFNATGGTAGQRCTFRVITSGTSAYTLTWSTNFKVTATLSTGTTSGKYFCVSFVYDGTYWCETGRTAAM